MKQFEDFFYNSQLPLGAVVEMYAEPADGRYKLTGSVLVRADYPDLDEQFPYPLLGNDVNNIILGYYQNNKYVKVKH